MEPGRKTSIRTVHRSACSIVVALIVVASVPVINAAPTTTAVVQGRDRRDATQHVPVQELHGEDEGKEGEEDHGASG